MKLILRSALAVARVAQSLLTAAFKESGVLVL